MNRIAWHRALLCGILVLFVCPGSTPLMAQDQPSSEMKGYWKEPYALLFNFNNVFTSGSILSAYRGFGIGGMASLSPSAAIRLGVTLYRNPDAPSIRTTTVTTDGTSLVSETFIVPGTTTTGARVAVDYLHRLRKERASPYLGVGVAAGWDGQRLEYTDDVTSTDVTTEVNNRSNTFFADLNGSIGVDFRILENFSLTAEYTMSIDMLRSTGQRNATTVSVANGDSVAVTETVTESQKLTYLGLSLGLVQGAALGLVYYF